MIVPKSKALLYTLLPTLALSLFVACDEKDPAERFAQPANSAPAQVDGAAPGGAPPAGAEGAPAAVDGAPAAGEGAATGEAAAPPPGNPPPDGVAPPPEEGAAAQGPQGPAPGPQVITEEMKKNFPCGDKICDKEEKNDPNLCPRDCLDEPAKGDDWCGDGICDARERFLRDCSEDCTSQ